MRNLQMIDLSFETHRLLILPFNLHPQGHSETRIRQMQRELMEHLRALPGMQSVSLANGIPVRSMFSGSREILLEAQEKRLAGLVRVSFMPLVVST